MRPYRLHILFPAAVAALVGLSSSAWAQVAALYTITDLGASNAGSRAFGVSSTGLVVGYTTNALGAHQATSWTAGVPTLLPFVSGDTVSEARGVNAAGVVVGFSTNAAGTVDKAVSWTAGVVTNLNVNAAPALSGANPALTGSRAEGISPTGEIVGHAYSGVFANLTTADGLRGFYRSPGGAVTRLDPATGVTNYPVDAALAYGINAIGQVFGQSDPGGAGSQYRASRWSNPSGSTVTPFTYPTAAGNPNFTEYLGFQGNNANRIVGTTLDLANAQSRPFAADTANGTTLLNNLGTGLVGIANAINNSAINIIVGGTDTTPTGTEHAAVWEWSAVATTPNLTPIDLNTRLAANPSGMTLVEALSINDAGQIVGFGLIGGVEHAFLLTPVPEPGTLALCAVGLGGLGLRTWRRRKAGA